MIALIIIGYLIGCFVTYVITTKRANYVQEKYQLGDYDYEDQEDGVIAFTCLSWAGLLFFCLFRIILTIGAFLNKKFNL